MVRSIGYYFACYGREQVIGHKWADARWTLAHEALSSVVILLACVGISVGCLCTKERLGQLSARNNEFAESFL